MSETRTLYMHLLDGQPGEFDPVNKYIYFAGKFVSRFASSLRQIRREQQAAMIEARNTPHQQEWADAKRYHYIRVRIPA